MDQEPTTIRDNISRFFDSTCERILDIMTIQDIYKGNKKRYNELLRIVKQYRTMSKPTFEEHMKHLIQKRFVVRKEVSKQQVYFYLNENNLMIQSLHDTSDRLKEEHKTIKIREKLIPSDQVPVFLSNYFAMCELIRIRIVLQHFLDKRYSKRSKDLLALAWRAKFLDVLQTKMFINMAEMVNNARTDEERRLKLDRILGLLDQAIEKTYSVVRI